LVYLEHYVTTIQYIVTLYYHHHTVPIPYEYYVVQILLGLASDGHSSVELVSETQRKDLIGAHTDTHTHKHARAYTHTHTHTHTLTHVHTHSDTHTHTQTHSLSSTHIHIHTHTHTHTYIHAHTYIHTYRNAFGSHRFHAASDRYLVCPSQIPPHSIIRSLQHHAPLPDYYIALESIGTAMRSIANIPHSIGMYHTTTEWHHTAYTPLKVRETTCLLHAPTTGDLTRVRYTHTHTHTHTHTCAHTRAHMLTDTHIQMHPHIHTQTCTRKKERTHTHSQNHSCSHTRSCIKPHLSKLTRQSRAHTHTQTHTHTHTQTQTYTHTHTYTYTHTHTY
jgi:hypothetical protein